MPMTCSICKHPERAKIERALVQGVSLRNIAQQFAVGYVSVLRHRRQCVPEQVNAAKAANKEARGLDVLEQLRAANSLVLGVIHRTSRATINAQAEQLTPAAAREEQRLQDALVLQAADRWHKQIELAARLQGELAPDTLNITLELAQAAVEDGHARERTWREQRGVAQDKPRLLDAG